MTRRLTPATAAAFLVVALLAGCGAPMSSQPPMTPRVTAPSASPTPSATPETLTGPTTIPDILRPGNLSAADRGVPEGVDPERIRIPTIGVDADVVDLGLNDDQSMQVPTDFAQTGWFEYSPLPGRPGAAVIAGHVDSKRGPAVFYRLRELSRGDRIEVAAADGTVITFEVERTEQYAKDEFPGFEVYTSTGAPELRLITCGGQFDRGTGSYLDNVVVYARRVEV